MATVVTLGLVVMTLLLKMEHLTKLMLVLMMQSTVLPLDIQVP